MTATFFFFFVSNPESDNHVMLSLKLNYIRLNFNNQENFLKNGKTITTRISNMLQMKEGEG